DRGAQPGGAAQPGAGGGVGDLDQMLGAVEEFGRQRVLEAGGERAGPGGGDVGTRQLGPERGGGAAVDQERQHHRRAAAVGGPAGDAFEVEAVDAAGERRLGGGGGGSAGAQAQAAAGQHRAAAPGAEFDEMRAAVAGGLGQGDVEAAVAPGAAGGAD